MWLVQHIFPCQAQLRVTVTLWTDSPEIKCHCSVWGAETRYKTQPPWQQGLLVGSYHQEGWDGKAVGSRWPCLTVAFLLQQGFQTPVPTIARQVTNSVKLAWSRARIVWVGKTLGNWRIQPGIKGMRKLAPVGRLMCRKEGLVLADLPILHQNPDIWHFIENLPNFNVHLNFLNHLGEPEHSLISSTFQPTIELQCPDPPKHTAVEETPPSLKEVHSAFQQFCSLKIPSYRWIWICLPTVRLLRCEGEKVESPCNLVAKDIPEDNSWQQTDFFPILQKYFIGFIPFTILLVNTPHQLMFPSDGGDSARSQTIAQNTTELFHLSHVRLYTSINMIEDYFW